MKAVSRSDPSSPTRPVGSGAILGDLERRNRRLEILAEIAKSITVNMSYGEIIERFANPLREAIPYDLLSFCLLEDGRLVIKSGIPRDQTILGIGTAMGRDYYIPWRAVDEKRACLRTDLRTDGHRGAEDPLLARLGIRSAVVAPLLVHNEAIGTLNLGYREPYAAEDAVYVQRLADLLAVCLQNSRLYRAVAKAEKEWERTFRAVQDLLVVIDRDGGVVRVNHGWGRRPVGELVGRHYREVLECCGGPGDPAARALETGQEASAEFTDPDLERALSVSAYPVYEAPGRVDRVVLCVRDVTAKRRLEAQVFQSAKLAAVGEMAAGVAHELNNPMTAIIGNASLLLRRTAPEEPAHRMLEDVRLCGQRCKRIVQNLLAFARQETYECEPVDVNEAVRRSLELVRHQFDRRGIAIDERLSPGLPEILGSAQQVEQIVVNLLLNARDAVEEAARKSVCVRTGYSRLETGELGVAVVVSDTGVGMPPERIEKVFHPFFTTKAKDKGTGLGLSVSLGIAKAFGGAIRVESQPGRGSTFTLVLPQMAQPIVEYLEGRTDGAGRPLGVAALETLEQVRPVLALARKLGRLQAQLAAEDLRSVRLEVEGATGVRTRLLTAAVLAGLLGASGEAVDLASAVLTARERGIEVSQAPAVPAEEGGEFASLVRLHVLTGAGRSSLAGALIGRRAARIVEIDGVPIEVVPEGHLLVFWAQDRPGIVGAIATLLADRGIRIGQMRFGHERPGGRAVSVFQVEQPVGPEVLEALRALPHLLSVSQASL
ncbi:MAG: hypothetical protein Kow0092_27360 [Deferrisomatales bacterium]